MAELAPYEYTLRTPRHETSYLSCGVEDGPLIIFLHGWPGISTCWRNQLLGFASLGFRAVAPDMRGYGKSASHQNNADYAMEELVQDMIELIDHLGAASAIWVGHDWGSSVVWSIAQHHPERCRAVANFCVPYHPNGGGASSAIELANRDIYPADEFPAAQWDYQLYYLDHFDEVISTFEANVGATIRSIYRGGAPAHVGRISPTATVSRDGGWFNGAGCAPDMPRDERVLNADDERALVNAFTKSGFAGPGNWYVNERQNAAFAASAKQRHLEMPVLFVHAAYDLVCETVNSRLADPMREHCPNLTEAQLECAHWVMHECPQSVNAVLASWLARSVPDIWPPLTPHSG